MHIPWMSVLFVALICLGFKIAYHLLRPNFVAIDKNEDPKTEDLKHERKAVYILFGTVMLLWYFLFWYLLPFAWPLFLIFSVATVGLFFEKLTQDGDSSANPQLLKEPPVNRILLLFLENPEDEFDSTEILKRAKLWRGTNVERVLSRLEKEGILKSTWEWPDRPTKGRKLYSFTQAGIASAKKFLELNK